jgi:DNA polymerase III subunit gamma/tau
VESPLALYRRYRPESFAEVIGQDHVTEPLRAALANNRANHAYLFSGPRGCGKTTSARILARTLNCAKAPIADPCGECDSCRELARGGSGSIDVIEIDAASHNGVDDARDLRERAFFSPVRDRYKVYIIDEAHMVTPQAFNALLKLVEEPPPHLRFIFATTEPEKVLGTIRSRTHHYPFRLIPPKLLSGYVAELCEREGVAIESAAIPLVVRAGAGSARDTLSVLDQLIGGAGKDGVTHALATGLLGYTPESLLDGVVDAFAASDGGSVFGAVDRVIESGQDPRRFAEDLLRRLRDLVIVKAVPEAPATGLIDVSEDQGERLVGQANRFGLVELSRAADLVAAGLVEMRGATAPRLLLELICARVLLPGADHSTEGLLARLERLERRMSIGATPSSAPSSAPDPAPAPTPAPTPAPQVPDPKPALLAKPEPMPAPQLTTEPQPTSEPEPTPTQGATMKVADVRHLWPDIVEATKKRRRLAWMLLTEHAQVVGADNGVLTLGFNNEGARNSFQSSGGPDIVRQAAIDAVGLDWRVEAISDPGAQPSATAPKPASAPAPSPHPPASGPGSGPATGPVTGPATGPATGPPIAQSKPFETPSAPPDVAPPAWATAETNDQGVAADDPMIDSAGLDTRALLAEELGAQVIEEISHD